MAIRGEAIKLEAMPPSANVFLGVASFARIGAAAPFGDALTLVDCSFAQPVSNANPQMPTNAKLSLTWKVLINLPHPESLHACGQWKLLLCNRKHVI